MNERGAIKGMRMRRIGTGALVLLWSALLLGVVGNPVTAHLATKSDDHGELELRFEEVDGTCEVTVIVSHAPVDQALFEVQEFFKGPVTVQDEQVNGTPEAEGEGFHFEIGPVVFESTESRILQLTWDDGQHGVGRFWSGECFNDAFLRVHETADGPAVDPVHGCTFFVEGRYVKAEEGTLRVEGLESGTVVEVPVTPEDMSPEPAGDGNTFMVEVTVDLSGRYEAEFHAPDLEHPEGGIFFGVRECSTAPPSCPTNVEVRVEDDVNVIQWERSQGALATKVYRAIDGGEMMLIDETEIGFISFDHDPVPGTYTYLVTAMGEIGESEGCEPVTVTVPADGDGGPQAQPECPPVGLHAVANPDESITLTIDGLDVNATLQRSVAGGTFEDVADLQAGTRGFADSETEAGTAYAYRLLIDGMECAAAEATAVPVFPSTVAAIAVLGVVLLGYGAARRHR